MNTQVLFEPIDFESSNEIDKRALKVATGVDWRSDIVFDRTERQCYLRDKQSQKDSVYLIPITTEVAKKLISDRRHFTTLNKSLLK